MASIYTPSSVELTTFEIPDDGDDIDAASVNVPFEALGDGLAYVSTKLFAGTVTRRVSCNRVNGYHTLVGLRQTIMTTFSPITVSFGQFGGGLKTLHLETGTTVADHYLISLDDYLIDGATLASATLKFRPAGTHGALPTNQPSIAIIRGTQTGLTPTVDKLLSSPASGHAILAAANVGAYEADQSLVFTPDQNNVIALSTHTYAAVIQGESGTNAVVGERYAEVVLVMTGVPDLRSA